MKSHEMPDAMLLDFGGVLVDVINRPDGLHKVALEVHELLLQSHIDSVGFNRVERDLKAGWKGYGGWKSGEGRRPRPREIGHREFWEEFVATGWLQPARDTVGAHASALCERLDLATKDRPPKPDSLVTLHALSLRGVRIAVVSNALCGAGTRGPRPAVRLRDLPCCPDLLRRSGHAQAESGCVRTRGSGCGH